MQDRRSYNLIICVLSKLNRLRWRLKTNNGDIDELIKAKDLADLVGVTVRAVQKAAKEGKFYAEKRDGQWWCHPDGAYYFARDEDTPENPDLAKWQADAFIAKCRQEIAKARLLEYQADKAIGELLPREDYERQIENLAVLTRTRVLILPTALAKELSAMDDPVEIELLLQNRLEDALREVSSALETLEENGNDEEEE